MTRIAWSELLGFFKKYNFLSSLYLLRVVVRYVRVCLRPRMSNVRARKKNIIACARTHYARGGLGSKSPTMTTTLFNLYTHTHTNLFVFGLAARCIRVRTYMVNSFSMNNLSKLPENFLGHKFFDRLLQFLAAF